MTGRRILLVQGAVQIVGALIAAENVIVGLVLVVGAGLVGAVLVLRSQGRD
jgi:hypothetical protein